MPSQIDVLNHTASLLGQPPLTALTDNKPVARSGLAVYDQVRQQLLMGRAIWQFAIVRKMLPARADAPASGPYTTWFDKPPDCLKVLLIGNWWPGLDLTDYREGETDADWQVEGGQILCDQQAPVAIKYLSDVTNVALMHPQFRRILAADIGFTICQAVTGSNAKQAICEAERKAATEEGRASNAFEKVPVPNADDTWIEVRKMF